MNVSTFRPLSAWVPIAMSLAALSAVLLHIVTVGTARQSDEGTAAHIWQLLIAGQVPVLIFYIVRWLPRAPRAALQVIGVQLAAAAAAIVPVYLLGWA
jgi:peptidoglycan/LPS O-acetylase OafA/YrhL